MGAGARDEPLTLPAGGPSAGEAFWKAVRAQFVMPPDLAVMNAANLCPASSPVLQSLTRETESVDRNPSPQNRARLSGAKENTRKALAEFLRVTPEEIVITRNTSESNNIVSNGLELKAGDEVVIFGDNHPSNNNAWTEKAKRFGFTVVTVEQQNPHPGPDYYIEAFTKALTPRTKVLAFTHFTNTVGDLFPAKEICAVAKARGVMTLLDGAQIVRTARRQPSRHRSRLLFGQRAQVAVRGARMRRPVRQRPRPRSDLADVVQRLSGSGRDFAEDGAVRAARRSDDDRVRRGAGVSDQSGPAGDRAAVARADAAAAHRTPQDRRVQGLHLAGRRNAPSRA